MEFCGSDRRVCLTRPYSGLLAQPLRATPLCGGRLAPIGRARLADIELNFIHPTHGDVVRARVDDAMTAQEIVFDLVRSGFLPANSLGYTLSVKGGEQIGLDERLSAAQVRSGASIRINPITEAGGSQTVKGIKEAESKSKFNSSEGLAIPGVRRSAGDGLTIMDIQKSPAAVVMLAHMYDDLQRRYERQAHALELERLKSSNRFTAALLLLVSQLVLGIGGNLLTQNSLLAALVLTAGGLQALLALYLSFRTPREGRREAGSGKVDE